MSKTQKSVMTSTSFKALKKALKTVFVFETEKKLRTLWWSQKYDVNFIFTTDFFQVFQVLPCCFKDQTPLLMTNNLWQNVLGVEIKESTLIVHICESSSSSSLAKRVQHVGNIQRQVKELHYHFDREKDMKNIQILMKWMNFLADPRTFEALDQAQSLEVIEYIERKPRNFFILINPVSGAGQGVKIFQEQVEPLFHKCQIESNVQITTSVDHVKELIHEMPLNTYDCLVCVGGDGSLHVILQEIMKRKDWQEAIRLPIGLIPSGSGNGLLWSILYHNDEAFQLLNASFVVAKGMGTPLDILTVEQKDLEGNTKKKIYSFLSVEWAMIADIDVDSEIFRSLGELRFFMSSVWHFFIARKKYFGTITYLLENKQQEEQDQEISGNWKQISGKCHIMWIMNVTHASSDGFIAPEAKLNDGYVYIMMLDGNLSRRQLFHLLISLEKGTHIQQPNVQLIKTKEFKLNLEHEKDFVCVDGEVVQGPIIQAQVHQGLGRIQALPRYISDKHRVSH